MTARRDSRPGGRHLRQASLALCLGLLVLGGLAAPALAQAEPQPAFEVAVHADGAATVTVTAVFDLTTDAERSAFRSLRNDSESRAEATERFVSRLRTVANATEDATGREMAITDGSIDLATTPDNQTGIVTLSVSWEGLAAVRGDRLVVSEPFASGFTPDGRFVVWAPDGYRIDAASPAPEARNETRAVWAAGTPLDGLEVTMVARTPTPTASPTPSPTATSTAAPTEPTESPGQPGLGFAVGALAVVLASLGFVRRGR